MTTTHRPQPGNLTPTEFALTNVTVPVRPANRFTNAVVAIGESSTASPTLKRRALNTARIALIIDAVELQVTWTSLASASASKRPTSRALPSG